MGILFSPGAARERQSVQYFTNLFDHGSFMFYFLGNISGDWCFLENTLENVGLDHESIFSSFQRTLFC